MNMTHISKEIFGARSDVICVQQPVLFPLRELIAYKQIKYGPGPMLDLPSRQGALARC